MDREDKERKELNDILNSDKFKAFEREREMLKKMKTATQSPLSKSTFKSSKRS